MPRRLTTLARERSALLRRHATQRARQNAALNTLDTQLGRVVATEATRERRRELRRSFILGRALVAAARQGRPQLLADVAHELQASLSGDGDRTAVGDAAIADVVRLDPRDAVSAVERQTIVRRADRLAVLLGDALLADRDAAGPLYPRALQLLAAVLARDTDRVLFGLPPIAAADPPPAAAAVVA